MASEQARAVTLQMRGKREEDGEVDIIYLILKKVSLLPNGEETILLKCRLCIEMFFTTNHFFLLYHSLILDKKVVSLQAYWLL